MGIICGRDNGTWTPMLVLQVLLSIAAGPFLHPHGQASLDSSSSVGTLLYERLRNSEAKMRLL